MPVFQSPNANLYRGRLPNSSASSFWRIASRFLLLCVALGAAQSARAGLVFNPIFDASTSSAPAGFFVAFNSAVQFLESQYSDPITINLNVGWGEINGGSLSPGNLGQSSTNQQGFYSYSTVKTALTNDSKSASDATAIAHLPANYPGGAGNIFVMSNAEAKALGLLPGNAAGKDGAVGFNSTASYTFDPNNRAIAGEYDFVGLAEHELTEIMGRYGLGQNGAASGRFSPIDLFRYLSSGVLDTTPANGAYFSIDGGNTVINTFNGTGGGDLSDWSGATLDSFNHNLTLGKELDVTPGDITVTDVIGYDLAAPEPSTFALFALGIAATIYLRRQEVRTG
uniref:Ice-binding protein C-terminal domain-containing protein n=1 Tax=Solibacter usitatus (strain Ellin6076) TaxID=234267 RepID=Q01TP5_SOLUE